MTTMELEARKAGYVKQVLTEVNDIELLEKISKYLNKHLKKEAMVEAPCQYSVEEVEARLKQVEQAVAEGRFITNEQLKKDMDSWW